MRSLLLAAAVIGTCIISTPAAASVIVLGNSLGRSCYEAARDNVASLEALATCNSALESDTLSSWDQVATYVNRGIVKLLRSDYASAIADFDLAIARDPSQAESYLNKGSALIRSGADPALAIPLFNEALKRKTKRPELAYFARAIAHEVQGNIKAAYFDYKRARDAAPRWERPAEELGRFQVRPAGGAL